MSESPKKFKSPNLDDYQLRAAHHASSRLLITAPAGSGKTRVLIERVKWLVGQGADPQRVLVLTFAHKAAKELRERLGQAGFEKVRAQTFHAWAYTLVRSLHTTPFRLINEEERQKIFREILVQLLHDPELKAATIKQARELNWSLTFLAQEIIRSMETLRQFGWTNERVTGQIARQRLEWPFTDLMLRVWSYYDKLLEQHGAFDFPLLISRAMLVLREKPALLKKISRDLDFLLVDEVQDSNKQELTLLKMISESQTKVTFVGDMNQAIYTWRGASPFDWQGEQVKLRFNYRSDELIIKAVNNFLRKTLSQAESSSVVGSVPAKVGPDKEEIIATRPAAQVPVTIQHPRYGETDILNRLLPELKSLGYGLPDVLILARCHNPLTNVKKLRSAFPKLRCGTVHSAKGLEAPVIILVNCSADRFGFPLPQHENENPLLRDLARRSLSYLFEFDVGR